MIIDQQTKNKPTPKKKIPVLSLDPMAIFPRKLAALAVHVSQTTLVRAYINGHLEGYTAGNRVRHSGAQLLAWLEAGGKTT